MSNNNSILACINGIASFMSIGAAVYSYIANDITMYYLWLAVGGFNFVCIFINIMAKD